MKIWPDQKPYFSANQYYRQILAINYINIVNTVAPVQPRRYKVLAAVPSVLHWFLDFAIAGPMVFMRELIQLFKW